MRNTHFGDGGLGFGAKFKGDLSLDSERKLSRKRGTKISINKKEDSSLRESQQNGISGMNKLGNKDLNRSITIN
jgi:hypothetical protein